MIKQYETVFILTPALSETQIKETATYFKNVILENGGEVIHEEDWGIKKLAYPIQKKSSGYYHLIEFRSEGDLVAKLELAYRRDERVIRFITVALDKYGMEYSQKRKDRLAKKDEQK
jgi:small subunit ribosomal protein S6